MLKIAKLRKKIDQAENILLITHQNPDGDALGATLAFSLFLEKLNKKHKAVCIDPVPKLFSFLPNIKKFSRDFFIGDYDLIIIFDCGDLKRTGFADRLKAMKNNRKKIANIDHHPKNDVHKLASLNLVEYEASSTAELIYSIIKESEIEMDYDIATCILCGIYTDTGGFQHSNTNPRVYEIASDLMHKGAKLKQITSQITNCKSLSTLKLWGLVLSRVRRIPELGLVTSVITIEDLQKNGCTQTDLAGVVNLINTIPESSAAILFSETEDGKIKASLRTEKNHIDVSKLAQIFGGGGLRKASGFTIEGKIIDDGDGGWKIDKYRI